MIRTTAFCLALSLGLLAQAAEVEPDWTLKFDKEINWQSLSEAGYLVIGTDDALHGIDPATGKTVWSLDQFKKMPQDFLEMLPGTQFGAITYKGGMLGMLSTTSIVDMITGKIMWDTSALELGNCSGQFYLPEAGGLLILGTSKQGKQRVQLVDIATGAPYWSSEDWYKSSKPPAVFSISEEKKMRLAIMGNQRPLFLPDGNFLEVMSPMGLRKMSSKDGSILWSADH
jgi:hypothetical protein